MTRPVIDLARPRALRPTWRWLLAGLAGGLALALALAALVLWRGGLTGRADLGESPPPHVPQAVDKSLGVTTDLSRCDRETREAALTAIEAAGLHWVRQRFPWDAIEPDRDAYDWAVWDEVVDGVARHNLELMAVLDGSPQWARAAEDAGNSLAPPVEVRDFGAFAAAFASRFRGRIAAYQIWDEPNIAPHWGARWVDAAAYARLLREGAIQVRAADPDAVVLLAALAPNVEAGGANLSDIGFLEALYQQGAAPWFDVVAAEPYGFGSMPDESPLTDRLNYRRAELLRSVMVSHGDVGKAVWVVAFGWTDDQSGKLAEPLPQVVQGAIARARQDWPWLGPMLWAAWSPDDTHGAYALKESGGTETGVLDTLSAWAHAPAVAYPGVYPANQGSGLYEGDWRVTSGGADIGQSGDRLTIPFWGTGLDLTVRRGEYQAFLVVSIDGQPANALPKTSGGRSFLVLYDPLHEVDSVALARALPEGEHRAEIVADRGWGQWAIVGWSIWREGSGPVIWLPAALVLCALGALAVAAYTAWPLRAQLLDLGGALLAWRRALDGRLALAITAGAALALYVMVGTAPVLLFLLILGVALLLRPETGLPLIALALPFYQLGRPLLGKVFSMVEILVLLTAIGWAVNWVLGRLWARQARSDLAPRAAALVPCAFAAVTPHLSTIDWAMMALMAVGACSLLWADHVREAAREFRTVILEAGLFYALLRLMIQRRTQAWRVVDAWVLSCLAASLVAVYQFSLGQNLITTEGVWRVRGFYGSPNNLALYLGRVLPLAVAVGVWGRGGWRRWAYAGVGVVVAIAIALTYSRGAWLLGVPLALLCLTALRGRRAFLATAGLLVAGGVVLTWVVGLGRMTSLLNAAGGTTFFRLQLWQSSWAMIRDHPILGVGLDNFLYAYRTHYVQPAAWQEFNLSHPHNLVLDFWLRLGLPGLAVLGWLLVAFFRRAWLSYWRLPEIYERLLLAGLMAGMVDFVAHGLVDNAFFLVDLAFVFVLMLALIQGESRPLPAERGDSQPPYLAVAAE